MNDDKEALSKDDILQRDNLEKANVLCDNIINETLQKNNLTIESSPKDLDDQDVYDVINAIKTKIEEMRKDVLKKTGEFDQEKNNLINIKNSMTRNQENILLKQQRQDEYTKAHDFANSFLGKFLDFFTPKFLARLLGFNIKTNQDVADEKYLYWNTVPEDSTNKTTVQLISSNEKIKELSQIIDDTNSKIKTLEVISNDILERHIAISKAQLEVESKVEPREMDNTLKQYGIKISSSSGNADAPVEDIIKVIDLRIKLMTKDLEIKNNKLTYLTDKSKKILKTLGEQRQSIEYFKKEDKLKPLSVAALQKHSMLESSCKSLNNDYLTVDKEKTPLLQTIHKAQTNIDELTVYSNQIKTQQKLVPKKQSNEIHSKSDDIKSTILPSAEIKEKLQDFKRNASNKTSSEDVSDSANDNQYLRHQ